MFLENDTIIAKKDISRQIPKGTKGVILEVYKNGDYYLVEFVDNEYCTIGDGLDTVSKDDIELAESPR